METGIFIKGRKDTLSNQEYIFLHKWEEFICSYHQDGRIIMIYFDDITSEKLQEIVADTFNYDFYN